MKIIYEDNHIVAVAKDCSEIVQGDKTGDQPLVEKIKDYLKEKYNKPGNVFCGVVHRIDRPVSGVVLFAKTGKALERLNEMLRKGEITKTYLAIVKNAPQEAEGKLVHYLVRNEKQNKSYAYDTEKPNSKKALMSYKTATKSDNYTLLQINLQTGRHHQIRSQLSAIGSPIKGDLKYGAKRSNENGGISLHAYSVEFAHPVTKQNIGIKADVPDEKLWSEITKNVIPL